MGHFVHSAKKHKNVVCLSGYRGNFQVVTDVHPVHIFLWDWVGTVQVSQQACWLKSTAREEHMSKT